MSGSKQLGWEGRHQYCGYSPSVARTQKEGHPGPQNAFSNNYLKPEDGSHEKRPGLKWSHG